jgi:homoserine O-acetyltransferase/O-succinyltransferase
MKSDMFVRRKMGGIRYFAGVAIPALLGAVLSCSGASYPPVQQADYVIHDFHFKDGESLPELRIHYRFLGTPVRDAQGHVTNAVLILHGTTGNGGNFIRPEFAGQLFGAGQLLDATTHFLVMPDGIGHGKSSKPSDGLHMKFPHYGYRDMIEAQYELLTQGLKVDHMRLIMGTSMGGMHSWLWGEIHPDFMDALMPLASLPTEMSGRNRMWRRIIIDAIHDDPEWKNGEYQGEPQSLKTVGEVFFIMGDNPVRRQKQAPTLADADRVFDAGAAGEMRSLDANDALYAVRASEDYNPGPDLEKIVVPLTAVNSADDLINPPELGILEREIKRVKLGEAVLIPLSDKTQGHGTHTLAALWKDHLAELLQRSERK